MLLKSVERRLPKGQLHLLIENLRGYMGTGRAINGSFKLSLSVLNSAMSHCWNIVKAWRAVWLIGAAGNAPNLPRVDVGVGKAQQQEQLDTASTEPRAAVDQ